MIPDFTAQTRTHARRRGIARRVAMHAPQALVTLCAIHCIEAFAAQPQQSALRPAGVQAATIARLWNLTLLVCGIVFALVLLATLVALVRNSRRPAAQTPADLPPDLSSVTQPERRARGVVIGVSALSVVVLIGLIVADVLTDRALSKLPVDDPVRIDMVGAQWWWQASYHAQDGRAGFTTANELHVPVGRPIVVSLQASDVIHSFWVPNLHGKKDMLPGIGTTIEFRADQPGAYRGQCAEYCGAEHALMAMLVVADPPERYAAWVEQQARPAAPTADALALHGRDVFEHSDCANCHAVRGTSANGSLGPDLTHLMSRTTIAAGVLANNPQNLAEWIRDPEAQKPGTTMPVVPLSNEDRLALVRWLTTLQ